MAFKTLHKLAQTYFSSLVLHPSALPTQEFSTMVPCGYLWSGTNWLDLTVIVSPRLWGQEFCLIYLSP